MTDTTTDNSVTGGDVSPSTDVAGTIDPNVLPTAGDQSPQTSTDAVTPGVEPSSTDAAPDNVIPINQPVVEPPATEPPVVEVKTSPTTGTAQFNVSSEPSATPAQLGQVFSIDGTKVVLVKAETLARILQTLKLNKVTPSYTGVGGALQFCDMLGIKDVVHTDKMDNLSSWIAENLPK
jgi:hypothetical protein